MAVEQVPHFGILNVFVSDRLHVDHKGAASYAAISHFDSSVQELQRAGMCAVKVAASPSNLALLGVDGVAPLAKVLIFFFATISLHGISCSKPILDAAAIVIHMEIACIQQFSAAVADARFCGPEP